MQKVNKKMVVGAIILCTAFFNETYASNEENKNKVSTSTIITPTIENNGLESQSKESSKSDIIKEENKILLELFKDLRVADVRDGMDWVGYHNFGSMNPEIRPLFRTHAVGIARTVRYLPYKGPYPSERGEEYTKWVHWYYSNVCTYPWINDIEEGDFMAIDVSGVNVGLTGSENTLNALLKGVRGFVFNGSGVRDTDEVIMQKIPIWSNYVAQSMVQCKIQFDAKDIPIAIGGVTIYPGDIIIADGDGVIVVPRKVAKDVAKYAAKILDEDKDNRKLFYEKLNWELDKTVTK